MTATPIWHPSPNFTERRKGAEPDIIVLHATAMASCEEALARLCDPAAEVSAHYLISETGTVWKMVDEAQRAWHAGSGQWCDVTDVNSRSIGVELANPMWHPFPEPQMAALEGLLQTLQRQHAISPSRVIAHSDMAPDRKNDPGPRFDWARLEKQGLARHRARDDGPDAPNAALFRAVAQAAGYTADVNDTDLLRAVRLRYRPHATGPLVSEDFAPLGQAALWT